MKKQFDDLRKKLIGLGEDSSRKSYYPELQSKIRELEESRKAIISSYQKRRDFMRNILHELRTPLHGLGGLLRLLKGELLSNHQAKVLNDMGKTLSRLENLVGEVQHIADEGLTDGDRYCELELNDILENVVSPILAKFCSDGKFEIINKVKTDKKIQGKVDLFKIGLKHFLSSALRFEHLSSPIFEVTIEKETIDHVSLSFILRFTRGILTDEQVARFYSLMQQSALEYKNTHEGHHENHFFGGIAQIDTKDPTAFSWHYSFDAVSMELFEASTEALEEQEEDLSSYPAVLLAEDNEINLSAMELILEDKKCRVFSAHNGKEAFDLFQQHSFSVVFMDMKMPVMGGEEAMSLIRAYEKKVGIEPTPIIAITAYAMAGDRERIIDLGASEYLAKPFDFSYFEQLVERYAKNKETGR